MHSLRRQWGFVRLFSVLTVASVITKPQVTVALPSFNQGRFLDAALRSIFAQSIPVEVMLADGGSTDETLAVIERWRHRIAWFRSTPDRGQSAAINEAIGRGNAPYVCWLNSDDLYLPGGLDALMRFLDANPAVAIAYGNCALMSEGGTVIGRWRTFDVSERQLSRGTVIAQAATLIRRSAWEGVNGLDESLHLSLDYDLWWRLHRAGARFARLDVDVAAARFHPAAKSFAQAAAQYAEAMAVVRKHTGSVPLIWRLKRPLSVGWRRSGPVLAAVAHFVRRRLI